MKRKIQKTRLLIVTVAILLGGSLAWASAAWLGGSISRTNSLSNGMAESIVHYAQNSEELTLVYFKAGVEISDSAVRGSHELNKNGVKIELSDGIMGYTATESYPNPEYRIYQGSTLKISVDGTHTIEEIVFNSTTSEDAQYGPAKLSSEDGSYTYSGTTGTWTGSAEFVIFNARAQFRALSISVYIKEKSVASPWTAPVPPTIQGVDIEDGGIYYIYNVGCGQFLTGANSWGTQISVTDTGAPNMSLVAEQETAWDLNPDTEEEIEITGYRLRVNGVIPSGNKSNTYLFRESDANGYVDWGSQSRNRVWRFTKDENGYYLIQSTYEDGTFWDAPYQYAYAGAAGQAVQFNIYKDNLNDVRFIEWALIPVEGSENVLAGLEESTNLYNARLALYTSLNEALEDEVDYLEASSVYNNENATLEEILAANKTLQANIARKRFADVLNGASEENPMDITDLILQNADFSDGDINGWACTFVRGVTATNIGYQSASYTSNGEALTGSAENEDGELVSINKFIEAWMQNTVIGNGELYQTVYGLPAGTYRLICDAISVDQLSGNNPVSGVQIFIATETGLESVQEIATDNGNPEHFSVNFINDGSDALTFGLRTRNATANWIAADNFRVIFYGKVNSVGAAYLKNILASSTVDTQDLICNNDVKDAYLVALATSQTIIEDETVSSDDCLAQADILKTAYEALTASVADYQSYESIYAQINTLADKAETQGNTDLLDALVGFMDSFKDGYTNRTLISEDFANAYPNAKALVRNMLTTDMQPGSNLTMLIENADFSEQGRGWINSNNATVNYNHGAAEVYHGVFDYYQVLSDMPAGVYNLSVTAFNRMDSNERTARLYGGISEKRVKLITDEGSPSMLWEGDNDDWTSRSDEERYDVVGANGELRYIPHSMKGADTYFNTINPETELPYYTNTVQIVLPVQGDLHIGIKCASTTEWILWDNFSLEYAGDYTEFLSSSADALRPYLADTVHYYSVLRDHATLYLAKAESGTAEATEAYTLIGNINNIIDSINASIEKYTILAASMAYIEQKITETSNPDETILAEVNSLLSDAHEAFISGSYTNEEAVEVSEQLRYYAKRLQSGVLYIELAKAGELGNQVLEWVENFTDVKGLHISGPMNADDLANIARMKSLKDLDMSEALLYSIESSQFAYNDSLQSVILPKVLTSLGYDAFYDCDGLVSATLYGNITSMGSEIFYSCDALEEVNIEEGVTTIASDMFENCYRLSKVTLPSSLISIGSDAFYNCYSLATISLPTKLQTIGSRAFYRGNSGDNYVNGRYHYDENGNYLGYTYDTIPNLCPKHLEIPASVTSIGYSAFYNLGGLETVTLNEGLTSIGYNAFYNTAVRTATFPSTLTSIGYSVFNSGTHYTCLALTPPTANNGCPVASPDTLYVPMLVTKAYKQVSGWSNFKVVGIDVMPNEIIVSKQMNLDFAKATIPEGYKPNIFLHYSNVGISSTNAPTMLGALEVHNGGTFSANFLELCYYVAQQNYYRYREWNYGYEYGEYGIPQYTTLLTDGTMRADNINIVMTLTDGYWNFISMPFDVRVGDIRCETSGASWVIRRYDGERRAAADMNNTWVNMGADDILEAGKGYIMHCTYSSSISRSLVFHFPALNTARKNLIFSATDRSIQLNEYESEFAHNRSWNLIGNPYPAYMAISSMNLGSPITVWNGYNGYNAYSPLDDDYILCPGEAFFVQSPVGQNSITFNASMRQSYYDVTGTSNLSRAEIGQNSSNRSVFNIFLSNDEQHDRTRVVINPAASMSYESERDAAKFPALDAVATQLYSTSAGVQYAINERPLSDGTVRLAAHFGKTGTYTLKLDTRATESVILIDEVTGTTMELNGSEGYTFTAEAGTVANRFCLKISGTVDAIENLMADELHGAEIFTLDGKRLPTVRPTTTGIYLVKKNGTVRKVSVK